MVHDCLRLRKSLWAATAAPAIATIVNSTANATQMHLAKMHLATAVADMVAHMHPTAAVTICARPFETWRSAVVMATAANYRRITGLPTTPMLEEE